MLKLRLLTPALALAMLALAGCDKGNDAPSAQAAAPATEQAPAAQAQPVEPASTPAPVVQDAPLYGTDAALAESVSERIKSKYPNLEVSGVRQVNITGQTKMFEFMAGSQVTYTNESVDFLIVGGEFLSELGGKTVNYTQKSAAVRLLDSYQDLPKEGAIEYVYGNGSREVVILSDPDCPYCQALEYMFETNKDNLNAKILVVPFPIDSLHSDADRKSRYLLCSQNPSVAWRDWMLTAANAVSNSTEGSTTDMSKVWADWAAKNPSTTDCERAGLVDKAKSYAQAYGFGQTPILMFTNGMPFMGLITRDELERAWKYVADNPPPR